MSLEKLRGMKYGLIQRWLFFRYDYTEAYRELMKYRIKNYGPEQSVGGFDLDIGRLQFEFLKRKGLDSKHTLLDLGCGVLRGGQHFIKYLEAGNYTGMDISESAIKEGKNMIEDDILSEKKPQFIVNSDLKFNKIDKKYDFIIAQSVFTHLPREQIDECFEHINSVLKKEGVFYATYIDRESDPPPKDFYYQTDELISFASYHNLDARPVPNDEYPHPRGQKMLEIRRELQKDE